MFKGINAKVDVVMCSWNSNKPYFVRCLDSIRTEVPVHRFILVDRFSRDGTVEAVRKMFPNAIIRRSNARLGVNRKLGIELVDTEFFVFVDSDVELCSGWFKRIISHLNSKTGAVHSVSCRSPSEHLTAWCKWTWKMRARFRKAFAREVVVITAKNPDILAVSAANTLIRTSLVKDYDPPSAVSACEDVLLLPCVVRKGYVWKVLLDPVGIYIHHHFPSLTDMMKRGRWMGAGKRLVRSDMSLWFQIRELFAQSIFALVASIQTKQPLIFPYVVLHQLSRVQGWVNWTKYLESYQRH